MASNPWSELIKQGFETFRTGVTNLSQGTASIAQAANNGIQPFQGSTAGGGGISAQMPQVNFGSGSSLASIADAINSRRESPFIMKENPNLQNNVLGREIQNQTNPSFFAGAGSTSGSSGGLGRAISQQVPSLFDRLQF